MPAVLGQARTFSSFAVDDLAAARRFYEQTLGLRCSEENGLLRLHVGDGQDVIVYPKPDFIPATYTVLTFEVDDIDSAVDALGAAGVRFERYAEFHQDERGIARGGSGPHIAWFMDPAGNILAVLQQP
jgi:catechol 2,3-dioxygenase-like lactoylglutathione lyase family enzyme